MHRTPLIGATLALALLIPGTPAVRAHHSTADVVFEWNQILQDTVPVPQNPLTPRFFAMTHIAMFDAVNAIEREFEPYRVRLRHLGYGSPDAAAAQAAHDVLVAINPSATAIYDAALARQLGDRSVDPRPAGRGDRRPGREGNPGVAPERRMGGLAVPALFRAAGARALAADAARQRRPGLHAPAECRAAGPGQPDAVPAAAAADADRTRATPPT